MEACDFWKPGGVIPRDRGRPAWLEAALNGRPVREVHDHTGELYAGNPHVQFGGQGVETDPWEPD